MMNESLLILSGWAHGLEAIRPMGNALANRFGVQLMTGAQVLGTQHIPDVDYIVTGSMGGLLAMELLPPTCKKLVLISSTARFCAATGYPCGTHEKILRRMILQLKRQPEAVLEQFYVNVHHPHPPLSTAPECSQEELVAGLEYLLESDLRERVADIGIPTLLLHGLKDRIIPPAAADWLHAHLPDSRLKTFENEGHALPAHCFHEVMDEITRFL
jgi:pimeloyl-[acyl-carrier protein] methyl ester esterase